MKLNHKLIFKNYVILFLFYSIFFFNSKIDAQTEHFTQTVMFFSPKTKVTRSQIKTFAKTDLIISTRWRYHDLKPNTWKVLKSLNPDIEIYIYWLGPEMYKPVDVIHRKLCLFDSKGNIIYNSQYPHEVVMDFSSEKYRYYWWYDLVKEVLNRQWKADGVYLDNCLVHKGFGGCPFSSQVPAKFPDAHSWNIAMNGFINFAVRVLHHKGQKVGVNRGQSRYKKGCKAWFMLDNSDYPPDWIMEEGFAVVKWGSPYPGARFFSEAEWKRQVDIVSRIKNSKVLLLSHAYLDSNKSKGIDNYGKPVTFEQAFWFAFCSYHLARRDSPNNAYFMFNNQWFAAYEDINLGRALGNYKIIKIKEVNIYYREFKKGFVFVNPTNKGVDSIPLPIPCSQINGKHVSNISLNAHTGILLLKPCLRKHNF